MQTDQVFRYRNPHVNGRLDLMGQPPQPAFMLSDRIPLRNTDYDEALNGQQEKSVVSIVFFSKENITHLMKEIQYRVYKKSNGRFHIAYPDEDNLKMIMRGIYFQTAHRLMGDDKEKIRQLDELVIDDAVPAIMSEAQAYIRYRHDVSTLAVPLDHPTLVTEKGKAPLEWKRWF